MVPLPHRLQLYRHRELQFRPTHYKNGSPPMAGTCRGATDAAAAAFRAYDKSSPIHDEQGNILFLLLQQLKGNTNLRSGAQRTKGNHHEHFQGQDGSNEQAAIADLFGCAFFFAMRSCE